MKRKVGEVAKAGAIVICENGFWSRSERDELRKFYNNIGVLCELHYIDTPDEIRLQNIRCRNKKILQDKLNFYLTDDKDIYHFFEIPTKNEINVRVKWESL